MGEPIREAPGVLAIYPVTERKGRAKQIQIILRRTSVEIFKSYKDFKNNKSAKHKIELSDLFNLSLEMEPNQVKQECIILMTPSTTYFMLPNDPDSNISVWFELMMERVRAAREEKLMRTVFKEEFFEAAWDILILKKPKLRKDIAKTEKCDDLADKLADIQGRKRLCVSPTCLLLFKLGVNPTTDKDQPFDKEAYIEIPLSVIASYGKQEKYFFVRVGRCSEIGSGELWMSTESGVSATQLHERISVINQRDADKRREQGIMLSLGGISSRVLKSRQLRERAQQNKTRELDARTRATANVISKTSDNSIPMETDPVCPTPEPVVSQPTPPLQSPVLAPIERLKDEAKASTPKKSSFADMAFKIGSKLHYSGSSSTATGTFTTNPEYSDNTQDGSTTNEMPPPRTLSPRLYKNNIAEDYMSYDPPVDSRKTSTVYAAPLRQVSVMSATDSSCLPHDLNYHRHQANEDDDYIQMHSTQGLGVSEALRYPIREVRSYVSDVSDSTESCYSTAAKRPKRNSASDFGDDQSHGQRAFSLGSKPPLKNLPLSHHRPDEHEELRSEDIRKRAHSAGSKTWGFTGQKRVVNDDAGDMRGRTGSVGTQARRKVVERTQVLEGDDHVEIDFGDSSQKGSMASIDSPSVRSRNSSFGVQASDGRVIRSAVDSAISKLRVLATSEEPSAAVVRVDEPRSNSAREHYPNAFGGSRRGSAPENASQDSDYVAIVCNKSTNRKIETITESAHSSSSEPPSPESMSDVEAKPAAAGAVLKKRPSIPVHREASGGAAGLEYAVINPQTSRQHSLNLATETDPSMIQPVLSFFGGPGGSMTPPPVNASPQYSSSASNSCEYTIVGTPQKESSGQ